MKAAYKQWVGVDLDGTLAEQLEWDGPEDWRIGPPIPKMVALVKKMLRAGVDVRIFTARAGGPHTNERHLALIEDWCIKHIGRALPITATKNYMMTTLYDDRAIRVEHNTGELCTCFKQ